MDDAKMQGSSTEAPETLKMAKASPVIHPDGVLDFRKQLLPKLTFRFP